MNTKKHPIYLCVLLFGISASVAHASFWDRCAACFHSLSWGVFQRQITRNAQGELWYGAADDRMSTTFARTYLGYRDLLHGAFTTEADKLKKGDVYIDVGCGLGLAPLALSQQGVTAVGISHVDFWSEIGRLKKLTESDVGINYKSDADGRLTKLGGIPLTVVHDLTEVVPSPIKVTYWVNGAKYVSAAKSNGRYSAKQTVAEMKRLHDDVQKLKTDAPPEFLYRVGDTRAELKKYAGKAKLISDLYGDFSYDRDPVSLVDAYFDALTSDGRAVVLSHGQYTWGQGLKNPTTVTTKSGEKLRLNDYLAQKYPDFFEMQVHGSMFGSVATLVLKKGPKGERPKISLKIETVSTSSNSVYDTSRAVNYVEE